jgi:hypothetical protein
MLSFKERQEVNLKINLLRKVILEEAVEWKLALQGIEKLLQGRRVDFTGFEDQLRESVENAVKRHFEQNPRDILYLVGASNVPHEQVLALGGMVGIPEKNIEIFSDYKNIKRDFNVDVLGNHTVGIILGPMNHSIPRLAGYRTLYTMIKETFPEIIVVRSGNQSSGFRYQMNAGSLKRAFHDFAFALYEKQMQEEKE